MSNGRRTLPWLFSIKVLIAVFQILLKAKARGAPLSVDASHFHINPLECYDRTTSCKGEVEKGFCETNFHYMLDRCPWSCRFCRRAEGDTMECQDLSQTCSEWVSQKECSTHPDFMAQNCKLSCELCDPKSELGLTDQETGCPIWAKAGGCQQYTDLVKKCPHSCQKYAGLLPTSRPENYDTFQNTSSAAAPLTSSQFTTPTAPSATIRTYSDTDTKLPMDLQKALGKDLWNDKLLSLTRKQNEYVTHPESRPPALPFLWPTTNESHPSNATGRVQNGSVVIFRPDGLDGGQQNSSEIVEPEPVKALPPRTYDSLLPKLAVSGPTWSTETGNEGHAEFNSAGQEQNSTGEDIWEEEREEDLDKDENGQQKGEVPLRWTGGDNKSELHEENKERVSFESGEQAERKEFHADNRQWKAQRKMLLNIQSSGSGDEKESKLKVLHMSAKRKGGKSGQKAFILGSGIEQESWKLQTAGYISPSNQNREEVNDEMSPSGSGKEETQEGSSLINSSGRGQE